MEGLKEFSMEALFGISDISTKDLEDLFEGIPEGSILSYVLGTSRGDLRAYRTQHGNAITKRLGNRVIDYSKFRSKLDAISPTYFCNYLDRLVNTSMIVVTPVNIIDLCYEHKAPYALESGLVDGVCVPTKLHLVGPNNRMVIIPITDYPNINTAEHKDAIEYCFGSGCQIVDYDSDAIKLLRVVSSYVRVMAKADKINFVNRMTGRYIDKYYSWSIPIKGVVQIIKMIEDKFPYTYFLEAVKKGKRVDDIFNWYLTTMAALRGEHKGYIFKFLEMIDKQYSLAIKSGPLVDPSKCKIGDKTLAYDFNEALIVQWLEEARSIRGSDGECGSMIARNAYLGVCYPDAFTVAVKWAEIFDNIKAENFSRIYGLGCASGYWIPSFKRRFKDGMLVDIMKCNRTDLTWVQCHYRDIPLRDGNLIISDMMDPSNPTFFDELATWLSSIQVPPDANDSVQYTYKRSDGVTTRKARNKIDFICKFMLSKFHVDHNMVSPYYAKLKGVYDKIYFRPFGRPHNCEYLLSSVELPGSTLLNDATVKNVFRKFKCGIVVHNYTRNTYSLYGRIPKVINKYSLSTEDYPIFYKQEAKRKMIDVGEAQEELDFKEFFIGVAEFENSVGTTRSNNEGSSSASKDKDKAGEEGDMEYSEFGIDT